MGSIIRFTHRNCGFRYDFHEGAGFILFRMQCKARTHMRNGDWGEHWKELIEQYPDGTATVKKALCYCHTCNKYFTESHISFYIPKEGFHYDFNKDDDMVPSYVIDDGYMYLEGETIICPDCKNTVIAEEIPRKILCPVCGEAIKGRDVGNWD